ncbi:hypothetical protein Goarm_009855, partial [Gossypium armourianum]|nr:hypothetical protein [Gossypium armourianum]
LGPHPSYTCHSIWSSKGLLDSGLRWKSFLSDVEAKRVLCIPLALSGQENIMVWRGDNTKEYIVRSGYKFLTIGEITTTPTN